MGKLSIDDRSQLEQDNVAPNLSSARTLNDSLPQHLTVTLGQELSLINLLSSASAGSTPP